MQDCLDLCAEHNVKKIVIAGNKQDLVTNERKPDTLKEI